MAKLHIKNTDGTFTPYSTIAVTNLDIVQGKGNSLTSAMSQKAVTDEFGTIQDAIASIVNAGYVFAGIATPSTAPGTPEAKVFYIAKGKGTYTNFGGLGVTEDEVVVLYYDTAWHKVSTGIASQAKLAELDGKIEDIGIEEYLDDTDEIQFNNDEDTESYAKIGKYGIRAKGFYHMDGTPISQGGSATGYINFNEGDDITSLLETEIAKGGDVHIYGTGIAYIHKPIKISKSHTHIHVGSGATLKLTDSLIDSYTPGNPIWMFYTPGSLYYWDDSRVRTETLEDILIEGGTLDFNGYYKNLMTSGNILAEFVGISIVDVDSFVLRNCTLLAASSFCTMFAGIHGFHIYDCVIHTTGGSHDGLHFHGDICNGIIENLTGETTRDDFVGLNTGGDFWKGWMEEANVVRKGNSFNITIRNLPKNCMVRLLNGKTHTLSGIVLENVPTFSITCYGEDAYYNDITIKGRSYDNKYYTEASMLIKGGYNGCSHTIHIKTLIIDSCIVRNSLLMLLANAEIENLMFNNLQYFAEPTPGQISRPDFTGLFPLIKTSNMYLQGDDFNATSVMGQSKVGRLYLNNCFVNDTRTLVDSAGVAYGVKIPAIINTDSIGKIFISNSDITVAKICVPDAQAINSGSSIINKD